MLSDQIVKQLEVPTSVVDVMLDTDAYNEIDDQFAIAYALLSPERMRVVGICAAPFFNRRSTSPQDGMERSYDEILKLLSLMNKPELSSIVYRGSEAYLSNEQTPISSPAAEQIVSAAREHSPENPLYVVALGALTNVASAILLDKKAMTENTVIVWLGGHSLECEHTKEFNMHQDVAAARVLFGCGAPLVQLPCQGVVSDLKSTEPELRYWLEKKNPLADYLMNNTIEYQKARAGSAWSKVIWDVSAVAWLMNEKNQMMASRIIPSPIPQYDFHYSFDFNRHPIRYVYRVNRDAIFTDLFKKLQNAEG